MKKITILALHLGYGGIERAISSLANLLCKEYEITIVSTYKLYDKPAFAVDKRVKIEYLIEGDLPKRVENYKVFLLKGKLGSLAKALWKDYISKLHLWSLCKDGVSGIMMYKKRKDKMIAYIKECDSDIILSTRDIHNDWLSFYGKESAYKIGWEHNHHNGDENYSNKVIHSVQNLDAFVLVSKDLFHFYKEKLKETKCKCFYIPNFIDGISKVPSDVKGNHLVSVGRLSKEKGHVDLIEVLHLLRIKGIDFHLDIIGAGPEEDRIREKIKAYDLTSYITLHGFLGKEQMAPLLEKASIFLLPSYTESFGLVILEAFAYGIPAIAFDSAQGATEIIENGWDGYLIENRDKEKMAKRIIELLNSYNRRVIMGRNAIKKAKKYTALTIKKDWKDLFEKER